MPVSKSFGGQADPLAGCCARQAHIVFLLGSSLNIGQEKYIQINSQPLIRIIKLKEDSPQTDPESFVYVTKHTLPTSF